jgi:NTE family protein
MVNDMRAGIGLVGEYFTVDSGEDEGHGGPKAYLIYNTLDDLLDPTRGFYVRTDLYWRDLDSLLGRMEFKGVTGIGGSRTRILLQGGFFAGDDHDAYSRAYLGAREELHSLADSPLSGENAAWWRATIRRVLTESWWGTINADLFFSQGYLLDDDLTSLEDPWELGLGFSIPGSMLNATVFAVYTDDDEWDFGATIGLPVKDTPFGP